MVPGTESDEDTSCGDNRLGREFLSLLLRPQDRNRKDISPMGHRK